MGNDTNTQYFGEIIRAPHYIVEVLKPKTVLIRNGAG